MSYTQEIDNRVPSRRTDRLPIATLVLVGQLVGGFLLPASVANGAYAAIEEYVLPEVRRADFENYLRERDNAI